MKIKSSFKRSFRAHMNVDVGYRSVRVSFKSFNDKIVKCWIQDNLAGRTFTGTAKCNKQAGDSYLEEFGMQIAFGRATNKRINFYRKQLEQIQKEFERDIINDSAILEKFSDRLRKNKLTCKKYKEALDGFGKSNT